MLLAIDKGFAPDLSPTDPGVLTACVGKLPTVKGMKSAPSAVNTGLPALAATALGAAVLTKLDGTKRFFSGTTTKLYEANGVASWTDATRASGGNYNGASDKRWRFAQFGDVSLAVQPGDKLQAISGGAQFADVSAAPRAAIVETVFQFVFLCGTNEATFGDSPNRWWCSAISDHTDWTPAASTQCTTDVLTSVGGPITAARRLGDSLIIYKRNAMYRLDYVPDPRVWAVSEVSSEVGAVSQEAVSVITTATGGSAHIFQGHDNFYFYDGSKPVPIGNPLKDWFLDQISGDFAYLSIASQDSSNSLVRFYFASTGITTWAGVLDKCLAYNYRANKWGVDDRSIEGVVEWESSGLTYSGLESTYATYADIPSISYGSIFWFVGSPATVIFNTSHVTQSLSGAAGETSLTTGDVGSDARMTLVTRVRPRDTTKPTSSTLTNYYRDSLGDSLTEDTTTTLSSNRYDVIRSARWHRFKKTDTGDGECTALDLEAQDDGAE